MAKFCDLGPALVVYSLGLGLSIRSGKAMHSSYPEFKFSVIQLLVGDFTLYTVFIFFLDFYIINYTFTVSFMKWQMKMLQPIAMTLAPLLLLLAWRS